MPITVSVAEMMSNALSQLAPPATASAPAPAPIAPAPLMGLTAVGLCVMAAWLAVRLARPGKLLLHGAPGRPNSVGVLHVIVVYAVQVIATGAVLFALGAPPGTRGADIPMTLRLPATVVGTVVLAAASAAVAAMCFRHGLRRGAGLSLRRWGLDLSRALVGFLVTIPAVLLTLRLVTYLFGALGLDWSREHEVLTFLRHAGPAWRAVAVGGTVVLAPLAEELFFRGLVQSMLKRHFGGRPWPAVVAASAVFAVAHLNEPQAIPSLFILSLGLGYNYERTGRLASPIFMHAIFNGVMIVLSPG